VTAVPCGLGLRFMRNKASLERHINHARTLGCEHPEVKERPDGADAQRLYELHGDMLVVLSASPRHHLSACDFDQDVPHLTGKKCGLIIEIAHGRLRQLPRFIGILQRV